MDISNEFPNNGLISKFRENNWVFGWFVIGTIFTRYVGTLNTFHFGIYFGAKHI